MSQEWLIQSWGLPLLIYISGQNYFFIISIYFFIIFFRQNNAFYYFWALAARKFTSKLKELCQNKKISITVEFLQTKLSRKIPAQLSSARSAKKMGQLAQLRRNFWSAQLSSARDPNSHCEFAELRKIAKAQLAKQPLSYSLAQVPRKGVCSSNAVFLLSTFYKEN